MHFHLLQQHLIELIRAREIPTALAFAQNELAPLAEEHPRFLKELEKTMALLAFELPTMGIVPAAAGSDAPGAALTSAAPVAAASVARSASLSTKEGKKSKKAGKSGGDGATESAASSLPPMPTAISSLLDPSQRLRTAWELNAAILHAQGHASEPKLPALMSIMNWAEGLLNEKGVDWPRCESPFEHEMTFLGVSWH